MGASRDQGRGPRLDIPDQVVDGIGEPGGGHRHVDDAGQVVSGDGGKRGPRATEPNHRGRTDHQAGPTGDCLTHCARGAGNGACSLQGRAGEDEIGVCLDHRDQPRPCPGRVGSHRHQVGDGRSLFLRPVPGTRACPLLQEESRPGAVGRSRATAYAGAYRGGMPLRVAGAQLNLCVGDIPGNERRIAGAIDWAEESMPTSCCSLSWRSMATRPRTWCSATTSSRRGSSASIASLHDRGRRWWLLVSSTDRMARRGRRRRRGPSCGQCCGHPPRRRDRRHISQGAAPQLRRFRRGPLLRRGPGPGAGVGSRRNPGRGVDLRGHLAARRPAAGSGRFRCQGPAQHQRLAVSQGQGQRARGNARRARLRRGGGGRLRQPGRRPGRARLRWVLLGRRPRGTILHRSPQFEEDMFVADVPLPGGQWSAR